MVHELTEKEFNRISIDPERDWHRFSVQSRGGWTTYDRFKSLDDAFQFVFEHMREDALFIDYIEVIDLKTGLVLSPDNLRTFHRCIHGKEGY